MWEILVILIFGYVSANKNENYEIVSCNDPNKESLHIRVINSRFQIGKYQGSRRAGSLDLFALTLN